MKFYNKRESLYLETDALGVDPAAALLKVRAGMSYLRDTIADNFILRPLAFVKKSLSNVEIWYSNTEIEVQGMLYSFQKCHHYCFVREVQITPDHKPLVLFKTKKKRFSNTHRSCSISIEDTTVQINITYQPGPDLYIADWISRENHVENRGT